MKSILIINGPNINLTGMRKKEFYGGYTLDKINAFIEEKSKEEGLNAEFFQSNGEGEIIDKIQKAREKYSGVIINAGALTHYSIAIRDAIECAGIPFIEVHMSNIYSREEFRRKSVLSDVCAGTIAGFKHFSYLLAVEAMAQILKEID